MDIFEPMETSVMNKVVCYGLYTMVPIFTFAFHNFKLNIFPVIKGFTIF